MKENKKNWGWLCWPHPLAMRWLGHPIWPVCSPPQRAEGQSSWSLRGFS